MLFSVFADRCRWEATCRTCSPPPLPRRSRGAGEEPAGAPPPPTPRPRLPLPSDTLWWRSTPHTPPRTMPRWDLTKYFLVKGCVADPGCLFRIPDPGSKRFRIRIKEFKYFNPKRPRKYDPGCSSRIRIPDPDLFFYPSRIPDPGVKKAPDPGSGSATLGKGSVSDDFWDIQYNL